MYPQLFSPALLVDQPRLEHNLAAMQERCDSAGVELRPHIKTHKCVEIARRQLQLGAAGLTCAKVGEAEAILPAFDGLARKEIFVANSLVDPLLAPRLRALREQLDDLVLAVTSPAHLEALVRLLAVAGRGPWPVMLALDAGLGREGARGREAALELAGLIGREPNLRLRGAYAHEGHFYNGRPKPLEAWHSELLLIVSAMEAQCGHELLWWPGCSVTAAEVAGLPGVDAVRPGAYVFGDLYLSEITHTMATGELALMVMATVVDRPQPGLALLDSGSKTLFADRTPAGVHANCEFGDVTRVSEEHGFLTGARVDELKVGQRIELVPAHVCPVVNLADELVVVKNGSVQDVWRVSARGKNH